MAAEQIGFYVDEDIKVSTDELLFLYGGIDSEIEMIVEEDVSSFAEYFEEDFHLDEIPLLSTETTAEATRSTSGSAVTVSCADNNILSCPYCAKTYKKIYYYENHVRSCSHGK